MKIKVEFTLDIPKESLEALKEVTLCDTAAEIKEFINDDAKEYIVDYLLGNGVTSNIDPIR